MARPDTGRKDYAFFIRLTEEEREAIRLKTKALRDEHGLAMSAVLRKVLLDHMNDSDFLKLIGMKE
ncbi:hypothetical protein WCX49_06730 [Sulfurimonas sp. HSL-1656]|uniref:hypothetical protein n=1 Tax=Thiomicrolovo subterrani TaxID=3131934 RepID=UPI0031F73B78